MASTPESGYSAVPESVFKKLDKSVEEDGKVSCEETREEYMVKGALVAKC